MNKTIRQGAIGALLGEYEKAIADLEKTFHDVSEKELVTIVDQKTTDENCRSIQTILSHVVSSAHSYAVYIGQLRGLDVHRPEKKFHEDVTAYIENLQAAFNFTDEVFHHIEDKDLECYESSGKIKTAWGQEYDIEQLTEHAIVHILRHRRQIEKFKTVLRNKQESN